MTKKELIEKLEDYPDNANIVLITYQHAGGEIYTNYAIAIDVFWVEKDGEEIKGVAIV